jgi:hypothetical protein
MNHCKKAQAVVSYAILIVIVGLALGTMRLYLQRTVQARVKDLTDAYIGDRQLATLNDPKTEWYDVNINAVSTARQEEKEGGAISRQVVSIQDIDIEAGAESLDKTDYGFHSSDGAIFISQTGLDFVRDVPEIVNPAPVYSRYDQTNTAQDEAKTIDGLGGQTLVYGGQNPGSTGSLEDNISGGDTGSSPRGSGGGPMLIYNGVE